MKMKIISLFFLIKLISSQITELKVGQELEDTIKNYRAYKIDLSDKESDYLVLTVQPKDNFEKFSDPDMYVSQVRIF